MQDLPADDNFLALSLALLELINQNITIELEQGSNTNHLQIHGTLLRAFDTPSSNPSISLMVGAHSITIRPGPIRRIVYRHKTHPHNRLISIHIHLQDNYSLHITTSNPTTT